MLKKYILNTILANIDNKKLSAKIVSNQHLQCKYLITAKCSVGPKQHYGVPDELHQ